jgi:hypothetical protein
LIHQNNGLSMHLTAPELLAKPPSIEKVDLLASKT